MEVFVDSQESAYKSTTLNLQRHELGAVVLQLSHRSIFMINYYAFI